MERRLACAVLVFALAACSGAGGGAIPNGAAQSANQQTLNLQTLRSVPAPAAAAAAKRHHPKKVRVKIRIRVPKAKRFHNPRVRHRMTVSENTQGIIINAYPAGNDTPAAQVGSAWADISPSSTHCSAGTNDARTCTISIEAPPDTGGTDFVATTYDAVQTSDTPTGNQLGYGLCTKTLVPGSSPTASFSLSSVLSQVELNLTPPVLHTIIPATATLDVYGLDADYDVIVSNGFIDGNGNPVTVNIADNNTLGGNLSLSTSSLTAPSPTGILVTYAGGYQGGGSTTVTFTASSSVTSNATTALTAIDPSFTSITDSNLSSNNPYHGGMIANDTGGVLYSYPAVNGGISYYSGTGTSVTSSNAATAPDPIRGGIAAGSGTNYAIPGNTFSTFGSFSPVWTPLGSAPAAPLPNGSGLAYGAGSLFWTSGTDLAQYNITGNSVATYPFAFSVTATGGVAVDSSGNVWVADGIYNYVDKFTAPSYSDTFYSLPGCEASDVLDDINYSGSEHIYVSQGGCGSITQLDTSGNIVNSISIDYQGNQVSVYYMMPDDLQAGIFWFDFSYNGHIGIGRMDTNNNPPTYSTALDPNDSCCASPGALATASNGIIYMVDDTVSTLVAVQR